MYEIKEKTQTFWIKSAIKLYGVINGYRLSDIQVLISNLKLTVTVWHQMRKCMIIVGLWH